VSSPSELPRLADGAAWLSPSLSMATVDAIDFGLTDLDALVARCPRRQRWSSAELLVARQERRRPQQGRPAGAHELLEVRVRVHGGVRG
jgi:hypothetical protein